MIYKSECPTCGTEVESLDIEVGDVAPTTWVCARPGCGTTWPFKPKGGAPLIGDPYARKVPNATRSCSECKYSDDYPDASNVPSGAPCWTCGVAHHGFEPKKPSAPDAVNHPSHYTSGKVECIDALEAATVNLTGLDAVCTANAIKYLWRWKQKNGHEDLRKARWYINKLLGDTP